MTRLICLLVVGLVLVGLVGCQSISNEQVLKAFQEARSFAEENDIAGTIDLTLNPAMEAGLQESVYLKSPGSQLKVHLQFDFDRAER